jgi:ABC-type phosphonate transport system ATPase subunit
MFTKSKLNHIMTTVVALTLLFSMIQPSKVSAQDGGNGKQKVTARRGGDGVKRQVNLLRDLPITMLVSTHDMKLVDELFPRTIVMDEGLIVADGETRGILQDEKFLNEHGLEKP